MSKKFQIVFSLILGLFVAIMVAGYISSIEKRYATASRKVPVLVAKKYIDSGEMIGPEDVEVKYIPQEYLQPRALSNPKDLLTKEGGYLYMAAVPIDVGEQIVGTKLFPLGEGTGVAPVIPAGFRAVTIVMDRNEVRNVILPGNRVDVIGVFEYYDKNGNKHEEAKTLLQNVLVLSVGKTTIGAIREVHLKKKEAAAALAATEELESRVPVSLAVTPSQAELLALAKEKASITFSVRAVGDEKTFELPGASMDKIFVRYSPKKPKTAQEEYLKALQKQQEEALRLLKKYGRR
ncbi:MAG: Flp pilus assembly protein CpaB [Caldiserica bacterium]|nr:MAG: Flp pilus assembly protein CpaB [Caldisericota bacterium]